MTSYSFKTECRNSADGRNSGFSPLILVILENNASLLTELSLQHLVNNIYFKVHVIRGKVITSLGGIVFKLQRCCQEGYVYIMQCITLLEKAFRFSDFFLISLFSYL